MSFASLSVALPNYAADLRANLLRQAADTTLTDQQKWGCFLACAFTGGEPQLLEAVRAEVQTKLSAEAQTAARIAAATMAMNTVYFGAVNLLANHDYRVEPHHLSMTGQSSPGVEKADFELWAFAVSALANCETCLNTHEAELRRHDVPIECVLAALRIASVVNAATVVLRGEGGSPA